MTEEFLNYFESSMSSLEKERVKKTKETEKIGT
jgi:hypothetical protein